MPHFVDLFLRFNRRMMFIVGAVPHELSVNESQVLTEVGAQPRIRARELVHTLGIEKSMLSRILTDFEKDGLIRRVPGSDDAREKELRLTARGAKLLAADSEARNAMSLECIAPLSDDEKRELIELLHVLADGLGATALPIREGDHPAKIVVRRLTRSMGYLSPSTLSTGFPVEEMQVVYLVGRAGTLPLSSLRAQLAYGATTIARVVTALSKRGLLTQAEGEGSDARCSVLHISPAGKKAYADLVALAGAFLLKGFKNLSPDRLLRLQVLLERFLPDAPQGGRLELVGRSVLRRVHSAEERQMARAFVVREIVSQGLHDKVPASIIADTSLVFGVYADEKIQAVCEAHKHQREWWIELVVASEGVRSDGRATALIETLLAAIRKRRGGSEVFCAPEALGSDLLKGLTPAPARRGERLVLKLTRPS